MLDISNLRRYELGEELYGSPCMEEDKMGDYLHIDELTSFIANNPNQPEAVLSTLMEMLHHFKVGCKVSISPRFKKDYTPKPGATQSYVSTIESINWIDMTATLVEPIRGFYVFPIKHLMHR